MKIHFPSHGHDSARREGFQFFPHRDRDSVLDGRDPHALIKADPLSARFPTEWQIGLSLWMASLGLYLASMCWTAFPGLPTHLLLLHLRQEVNPSTLDTMWGWVVKLGIRAPGMSVAGWTGLFSAVCGATAVMVMGRLMMRVGYLVRNEPGSTSFIREAQARRLSGVVAGIFLACCIPFWVVSTRSLPGSFHSLMLLLAAWFFSQYQHGGRKRYLAVLGLMYGAGIAESSTFIVFLPVMIFLVAREMFRWQALRAWKPQLAIWLGLLAGLSFYGVFAHLLFRNSAHLDVMTTRWQALYQILRDQFELITRVRHYNGFLVAMCVCLIPWITLFVLSRRSPWFYEIGQVIVRLIFLGGLLGVLFNATYSPWNLMGMNYLMVVPYLLMAVCVGYIAGEFWILGEAQPLVDITWRVRWARHAASALALLLPLAAVAGGFANWRVVDGRYGGRVEEAAKKILERLNGRDVLFSTGVFDETLRLLVRERRIPVRLVSAPRTSSIPYLRQLGRTFVEEELRIPLEQGSFGLFLDNLLLADTGVARTAIIDMPDVFREYGYLVPDGYLYRLETEEQRLDLSALVRSQAPFWKEAEQMALHAAPERNLARPYHDMLRLLVSKVANNLGVMQAERGDVDGALDTFRSARRIYPGNTSTRMNLLEIARTRELPEKAELEEEWAKDQRGIEGGRWSLALQYGYVWNAREWVRRGQVWALSGAPVAEEAARRKPPPIEDETKGRIPILDRVYLQWGIPPKEENHYRQKLITDEKDTEALMALCRLALRRNDPEAAESYIEEALHMGLGETEVLFDRAMVSYVRDDTAGAVAALDALSREQFGDPRVWMGLLLMTEPDDPRQREALRVLRTHRGTDFSARLSLAQYFMDEKNYKEAQVELEQALQLDSRSRVAWELMVSLSEESGDRKQMDFSLRALLKREPEHYLQYQNEGVAQYQKGNLEAAEAAFRKGVQRKRDATLLNNLAHVLLTRRSNLDEALGLMNEAMRRQPGLAGLFTTRGEIYMAMGRFADARDDFQTALRKKGWEAELLFKLVQCYAGLGDRSRMATLARSLRAHEGQLDELQRQRLEQLEARLR